MTTQGLQDCSWYHVNRNFSSIAEKGMEMQIRTSIKNRYLRSKPPPITEPTEISRVIFLSQYKITMITSMPTEKGSLMHTLQNLCLNTM